MFTLKKLSINTFIIVKESDLLIKGQPLIVHGFIHVIDSLCGHNFVKYPSDELAYSDELKSLRNKAVEITREHLFDDFFVN